MFRWSLDLTSRGIILLVPCSRTTSRVNSNAGTASSTNVNTTNNSSNNNSNNNSGTFSPASYYPEDGDGPLGRPQGPSTDRKGSILQLKIGQIQCRGGDFLKLDLDHDLGDDYDNDKKIDSEAKIRKMKEDGIFFGSNPLRDKQRDQTSSSSKEVSAKGSGQTESEVEWGYDTDRPRERPVGVVHVGR